MSSPIFDSTFGTGRFRREEPMTAKLKEAADLFDKLHIRHLLDEWFAGPNPTNVDALADVLRLRLARAADRSALAQSDAGPKHDVRVTDAMVEAAGEAWLRARFNIGRDGITEDCWFEMLSAMRVVLDALAEAIAAEIQGKPEFKEMIAREKPEASGLIEVLAGDLGLILRGLIAKYHGPLRARAADRCEHQWIDARNEHVKSGEVCLKCGAIRAADRSVHGDLIPDCPTNGVAARQGNGG